MMDKPENPPAFPAGWPEAGHLRMVWNSPHRDGMCAECVPVQDALAITTYHNTYTALLDRAARCDELEGVLAAVEQGASNTIHLISAKLGELEAENARLRADNAQIADLLDCALDEYEGHNGRRKATPEYAHWSVSARAALKGGDDGRHD